MSITAFLSLGSGNLTTGFDRISFRLELAGQLIAQTQASLPGNSALQDLHYQWEFCYAAYYDNCVDSLRGANNRRIELESTGISGFSVTSFAETTIELAREMRQWLNSGSFGKIGTQLTNQLNQDTESIVTIESADDRLYRLPWHYWSAIADYPQVEITFSLATYQQQPSISHRTKPRVLAVFGDRMGLDTTADARSIQQLPADLVTLTEPSIVELQHELNDRQGWDILFFAGHGSEDTIGAVHLNPTESVTLTDIRDALDAAIGRGLNLAIFNCCSGLGLATSLAALNIPTAIVMREAVPNRVAQDFLQTFLTSFERGNSIPTAVAAARRQLQSIESDFPCASWLPAIFWNPTVEFPTWKSFYPQPPMRLNLWKLGAIVVATTVAIWGARNQGYLEPAELAAYDLAMNLRPIAEAPDDRILIIGVNRDQPLSDRLLVQTLNKLQRYRPQSIGLDIYRDRSVGAGSRDLTTFLQQPSTISSCLMSDNHRKSPGIAAPAGVKLSHVGFTNFSLDSDGILRRQLIGMAPVDRSCQTDHSLSLRLALKYLNIAEADESENGNINIGSREVAMLGNSFGAYRSIPTQEHLRGFQVMLNYRNATQIAPQIDWDDVLNDRIKRQQIQGKVVLIGYTGRDTTDSWRSLGVRPQLSGVEIHAQMTSNILSHILDDRALITTWNDPIEFGWILLWGIVGGVIWLRCRGFQLLFVGSGAIVVVVITCAVYLNFRSIWIPLIPTGMTVVITPLIAMGIDRWQLQNQASK
jgi:CHASE2 domain-containing sensor protein